jgi:DNA-binding LytR/AlgR family response regulator
MRPLRAVIAEDETNLRDELREALARAWPELIIAGEAQDGDQAMAELDRHSPDVLFLDVQMPGATGLEVAKRANGRCHVVFVTAYDKYAVDAFEQGAVDYVMKPFTQERLEETVRRVKARAGEAPANLEGLLRALGERIGTSREYLRYITAAHGDEIRLITANEICYFQAHDKYTMVVTPERESLIRRQIKEIAESVDPNVFWQIHRSTIVNIDTIAGVVRDFQGHLRVRFKQRKETLPVSERYVHLFKQM